jgi:hypothetical protein
VHYKKDDMSREAEDSGEESDAEEYAESQTVMAVIDVTQPLWFLGSSKAESHIYRKISSKIWHNQKHIGI